MPIDRDGEFPKSRGRRPGELLDGTADADRDRLRSHARQLGRRHRAAEADAVVAAGDHFRGSQRLRAEPDDGKQKEGEHRPYPRLDAPVLCHTPRAVVAVFLLGHLNAAGFALDPLLDPARQPRRDRISITEVAGSNPAAPIGESAIARDYEPSKGLWPAAKSLNYSGLIKPSNG